MPGDFAAMQEKPDRPASARMQVVYNPTAGRRRLRVLEDVLARLRSRGVDIVLHPTGARGDAERLAAEIDPDDLAVAAGGDGTINEVVNGQQAPPFDSVIVDPHGRVLAAAVTPQGAEATLVADVPLGGGRSLAVAWGDWVGWGSLAGLVGFTFAPAFGRRRPRPRR